VHQNTIKEEVIMTKDSELNVAPPSKTFQP